MGKLSASDRRDLPKGEFAGPGRSYPINDPDHARAALSRVSEYGDPELKARVRRKVHEKFPDIGQD
jgi:hypothetical protein